MHPYHSLIPPTHREKYLDLLSQAENLLPQLAESKQAFSIVIQAASAVRGSHETLARMKFPPSATDIIRLKALIVQSRKYTATFWQDKPFRPATQAEQPNSPRDEQGSHPLPSVKSVESVRETNSAQRVGWSTSNSQLKETPPSAWAGPLSVSHLDQYIHLLSSKLQKQAAILPQKYAELNDFHETLDRLAREDAADPNKRSRGRTQRAFYAKKVDLAVRAIDAFWKRVDAERQALAGGTVTQEYQLQLMKEEEKYPLEEQQRSWGEYSKVEIEQMAQLMADGGRCITLERLGCSLEELKEARINRDKSLLRRKLHSAASQEDKDKRILAMEELHEWGMPLMKAQVETLKAMGIEVPESYISPFLLETEEEKRERKRATERKNYEKNKPLAVKMDIARKMRKAKNNDNPYTAHDTASES
jgi:hypothetical protein